MSTTKPAYARVLCDVPSHGLRVGQLLRASAATVASLASSGSVDPHPDAVAYAESTGAAVASLDGFDDFADTQPATDAQPDQPADTAPRARRGKK